MIQEPFTITSRCITCPGCRQKAFRVGHLPVGTKTTWSCDQPDCGIEFSVNVLADGNVETIPTGDHYIPYLVTLRSETPVTIVIKHEHRTSLEDAEELVRFYFEEHTCPTNYLGVEEVRDDAGDDDPHGIFKFVKMEAQSK